MNAEVQDSIPKYIQIRLWLKELFSELAVGSKIPTENELCLRFNTSRMTVRKSIAGLIDEGILASHQGKGIFLKKQPAVQEKKARSKMLALMVPIASNSLISQTIKGVEHEVYKRGYDLLFSHHRHTHPEDQLKHLRQLLKRSLDGLIIFTDTAASYRPEYVNLLKHAHKQGTQIVFIDHYFSEFRDAFCVMSDNVLGMYRIVEHLILSGRRRLALLGLGDEHRELDRLRRKGFHDALSEYGFDPMPVLHADLGVAGHEESAYKVVKEWIKQYDSKLPFDSIVCMQDNMAYGAYMALRDAGLKVPQDVAITGYDNLDAGIYRMGGLDLTSVEQYPEKTGEEAARLLIDRLEGIPRETNTKHVLIKPDIVVRSSCGANLEQVDKVEIQN